MKNTIIISAATYFVLNFLIWMLGWVIWPILWVVSGLVFLELGNFLSNEKTSSPEKFTCGALGPIMLPVMIIAHFDSSPFDFSKLNFLGFKLPSIRNPFVWPEKHDD